MPIELYTDGSCIKNPGPGGLGFIIRYWTNDTDMPSDHTIEGNQGFRLSTNNRMEILAGIYGIREIIKNIQSDILAGTTQINLTTDSKYFCDAINQKWINKWMTNNWMTSAFRGNQPKPVRNKDLWEQVIALQNQLTQMNINLVLNHIPGHSGYEWNEKADKLASDASGGGNYMVDEIYEKTMAGYNNNNNNWRN